MVVREETRESLVLSDRYRVLDRLGTGGMATVYLAEDEVLGRLVAVKRLRAGDAEEGVQIRRFRREARLGAKLSHPNLVTVFDTVAGPDGVLIVMEYVEGATLADLLDQRQLGVERALPIVTALAAGLDHAHERGIVHRDVKPANVLVGDRGVVKLADLGIATAAEATRITNTADIVGTLPYIAPERLAGEEPGGPACDVYSFGVVAFEALVGERLRRGPTPEEALRQAADAPPPDLRAFWPDAPADAAKLLVEAMDPDPAARPRCAGEVARGLEAAIQPQAGGLRRTPETVPLAAAAARRRAGHESDSEETAEWTPPPLEASSRKRSARRFAALAAAAAIAVAGVDAVVGGEGRSERSPGAEGGRDAEQREASASDGSAAASATPRGGVTAAPGTTAHVDPALGARLNDRGYALIQQGRYAQAVGVLERAVGSFPPGTTDLAYAYALYNLAHALRLSGRPAQAVPILEQRLQIPNQRGVVKQELKLARAESRGR